MFEKQKQAFKKQVALSVLNCHTRNKIETCADCQSRKFCLFKRYEEKL